MAARKRTWTPDLVRERIRISMLRHRLENHVLGKLEMSATQIKAAEILLRKCLPDLSAVQHTGNFTHQHAVELSEAALMAIATGSSPGTAEEASRETESPVLQ